jgi:protein SCO1
MSRRRTPLWCVMLLIVVKVVGGPHIGAGHQTTPGASLRKIGPAPAFSLTTQDSTRLSLKQLRGKVVVITFIYTRCADTCPLLTAKMAGLQARLGTDFGSKVFFVAITVDPEQDTPVILKRYAETHGVDLAGWAFLTGTPGEIREVARQYGVVYTTRPRGDVDHTLLTSIVDTSGTLRVQYMGVRFAPDEFLRDLHSLLPEGKKR